MNRRNIFQLFAGATAAAAMQCFGMESTSTPKPTAWIPYKGPVMWLDIEKTQLATKDGDLVAVFETDGFEFFQPDASRRPVLRDGKIEFTPT